MFVAGAITNYLILVICLPYVASTFLSRPKQLSYISKGRLSVTKLQAKQYETYGRRAASTNTSEQPKVSWIGHNCPITFTWNDQESITL